jgi:hypothetical protein
MSDIERHIDRRGFLKQAVCAGTGVSIGGALLETASQNPAETASRRTAAHSSLSQSSTVSELSMSLDGEWSIAIDPKNSGRAENWFTGPASDAQKTYVPSIIQEIFPAYHGVAWYWRDLAIPAHPEPRGRYLLRFDAVDYLAEVWINGTHVGEHEGGETPFDLDITDAVKISEPNLIAVRVLNPDNDPIDGIVLKQTPHRNKYVPYFNGATYDNGGIIGAVTLALVPSVRVEDLFVQPDWKTGMIRLRTTVRNVSDKTAHAHLQLTVGPAATGSVTVSTSEEITVPQGDSVVETHLSIPQARLWNLDDPYLYRVTARVETREFGGYHEISHRCGFRDFRVVGGYFRLNGRRIFLRSTHTGNVCPVGQVLPPRADPGLLRKDLLYAKAAGFNIIRFIGLAYPYQLDLCDELGLLIEEESYAGWLLEDSPQMKARFDSSTRAMILRDRNHACVVSWQLLNETDDGPLFRHAVETLPLVRSLDDTRLVLLSSGRFDGDFSIGTVSNPDSREWEPMWGKESPQGGRTARKYPSGVGSGDFHFYPIFPMTRESKQLLRTLGQNTKPVFLSEYGIGSLMDVIQDALRYEQIRARPDLEDFKFMREMADGLASDWKRYGMEGVYAFPEDMLVDSQRRMARHRLAGFNLVRSNPNLCGFNVTGMLDHAMTGEGVWGFWRNFKPGAMDVMQDGWWPLRWCLFVDSTHNYVGRSFEVEAVLATEDVLDPGRYPARFHISGPRGNAWEKRALVEIPMPSAQAEMPFAVPVLKDQVTLDVPTGSYELVADLEEGGAPLGRSWQFYLTDPAGFPAINQSVVVWGVDAKAQDWLKSRGVTCFPFGGGAPEGREVILVGNPPEGESKTDKWKDLAIRIARGGTAVFLSHAAFQRGKDPVGWLPLSTKGRCYYFVDHLYHKECVAKAHPIFEGLQSTSILDWYYYGQLIPHFVFDGQSAPDEVIAASFAVGYGVPDIAPGYSSGILMSRYSLGSGEFILNTFPVLDELDNNPAADLMLLNMIHYSARATSRPPAELPSDFNRRLAEIGYSV